LKTADWEEWREKKIFKADDWRVEPVATQPVPSFRGASRYKHQTAADHLSKGGKRRRKAESAAVLGPELPPFPFPLPPSDLDDQATLGGGWMPWGQEPTKGAAHRDRLRGAASTLGSGDARMRQRPHRDGWGTAHAVGNRGN
jgi:hypothetical protein